MVRLNENMTIEDLLMVMSDGNPGALAFFVQLLKQELGLVRMLHFDTLGVYGVDAYMLWNDCCSRDMGKVMLVLDSWCTGDLSKEEIHKHINRENGRGYAFDFESLTELLRHNTGWGGNR